MFRLPVRSGVDGHTITPGYEYDAAKRDMTKRLNLRPEDFFLTRAMTVQNSENRRLDESLPVFSEHRSISNFWLANET